jgi:drug/metabolite transporter (DMT)-like permease
MDQRANWLKLLTLGVIWGASFMFSAIALRDFGPMTIAAWRITLGAVALLALARFMGKRLPRLRDENGVTIWIIAISLGVLSNALPFTLLNWGQNFVASGFAGVSMAIVPLLVLPLAHFLVQGERMSLRRSFGFIVGFGGVIILIGPDSLRSSGNDLELWGRLACVAAAGCYAIGMIVTRLCPDVDRISLAAAVLVSGAVIAMPLALYVDGVPQDASALPLLSVLFLGLFPTALAQILLVQVIRDAGPTFMTLVNYQVPVWSVIFGIIFLSEPVQSSLFLALALILTGLVLSQFGALRRMITSRRKSTLTAE